MAAIEHRGVMKEFADGTVAVDDLPSGDGPTIRASVELTEQLGSEVLGHFRLDDPAAERLGTESEAELSGTFVARLDPRARTGPGELGLVVAAVRAHIFDPSVGGRLRRPS